MGLGVPKGSQQNTHKERKPKSRKVNYITTELESEKIAWHVQSWNSGDSDAHKDVKNSVQLRFLRLP